MKPRKVVEARYSVAPTMPEEEAWRQYESSFLSKAAVEL